MKLNLIISLFIISSLPIKITNRIEKCDNVIPWEKDRPLNWSDFRSQLSQVEQLSGYGAVTNAKIKVESYYSDNKLEFLVCNLFQTDKSWRNKDINDQLLLHEQMHFNIDEIFTRKIRQSIDSLSGIDAKEEVYWQIINDFFKERNKYSNLYDEETYRGMDYLTQAKWNKRIIQELDSLNRYYIAGENGKCSCK